MQSRPGDGFTGSRKQYCTAVLTQRTRKFKMEDDLELEHEGAAPGSTSQPVRRNISLKLKTKSKSASSLSSGKSKKKEGKTSEKSRTGSDGDKESKKKQKSPASSGQAPQVVVMRELKWDHQILPIGQKVQDPLLHLCEKCSLPILVYGRLSPCKHSFCLTCAEKGNGKCPRCGDSVQRIERAPLGSVYVCSVGGSRYGISGCRRSYFSQRDLQSHIKRRHQREQGGGESDGGEEAENEIQRAMFPQAVPFFPAPLREALPAVPPHPILAGERPFGNVGTVPVMDGRHFPGVPTIPRETFFMEGPRPQHPVVSGFPTQAPAPAPIPHVPQGGFPRPEQGPSPRFEEMRVSRPMAPAPIEEGFGPRPVAPGFPGRFPGPPRSDADWIPGERGPPIRGERDWIPPPGRGERDWIPPRSVPNMVPPGAPPPGRPPPGDPHFRPMF